MYIQDDLVITSYPVRTAKGELLSMPVAPEAEAKIRQYMPFVRLITLGEGEGRKVVDAAEDTERKRAWEVENQPTEAEQLAALQKDVRAQRAKLLSAFDVYKANLYYGIESETEDEKTAILAWYDTLLVLPEAVSVGCEVMWPDTPEKIARYIKNRRN